MEDNSNASSSAGSSSGGSGTVVKLTGTMVVTVFFFFLLVLSIFFVYIYAHRYQGVRSAARRRRWSRRAPRTHFVFAVSNAAAPSQGLDPSVLFALPVTIFRPSDFEEALECAVCLTEVADGETARILPKCNHGFHLECIDMWFHSHSTCPICRCQVAGGDGRRLPEPQALHVEGSGLEEEGALYVSIPVRSTEMFQSSSPPRTAEAPSPATLRVGSYGRILSRGKRPGGSAFSTSPKVCDIEQGLGMESGGGGNGEGSSDILTEKKALTSVDG